MILQRAVIVETGTDVTDSVRGLYSGWFAWLSGQSVHSSPTFPDGPWGTQEDWQFGILGITPVTGPYLSARLGPTGGYSSMGSMDVDVAQSDFFEYLRQRGIVLGRKRVWHYVVVDGVWKLWFVGVVDNLKNSMTGCTISCVDLFKIIHQPFPRVPATVKEFPDLPTDQIGTALPVTLGFVNDAELVNMGAETGKELLYQKTVGGVVRTQTMTGCRTSSTTSAELVVGEYGQFTPPDWVGKTLVINSTFNGEGGLQRVAYRILSQTGWFNSGFTLWDGSTINVGTISVNVSGIFVVDASDDSFSPTRWSPDFPNEWNSGEFPLSASFEIWDFEQTRIVSQRKVAAFVGQLKTWTTVTNGATKTDEFVGVNQVAATLYPQIPDSTRAGALVTSNDNSDPQGATLPVVTNFYTPAWATFHGYNDYGNQIGSSGWPALYSNLPSLIDKDLGGGYEISFTAPTRTHMRILIEVPIPDTTLDDGDEMYLCVDWSAYQQTAGLRNVMHFGLRIEPMDASYSKEVLYRDTLNDDTEFTVLHPINDPATDRGGYLFSRTFSPSEAITNVRSLPPAYYSGVTGSTTPIVISGVPVSKYFNVSQAFTTAQNSTKTLLCEVMFKLDGSPTATCYFNTQQIGFVKYKNSLTVPDGLFNSGLGELYGTSWGSRRDATKGVASVPDIIEHIIRAYDEKPDLVDTASFDRVLTQRPAYGIFGWWAGSQTFGSGSSVLDTNATSADTLDVICKNALLLLAPGLDGKRRLVSWTDNRSAGVALLDDAFWSQGSLSEVTQEDSQDVFSEYEINSDQNVASGGYNRQLQVNNTDQDAFPLSTENWQEWVVGILGYDTAKSLWTTAHDGWLVNGNKNRLVLNLPWIPDAFNGDPWATFLFSYYGPGSTVPPHTDVKLLSALISWASFPKRFVTGRSPISSANLARNLGDCVIFQNQVLSGGKRYYAWITGMKMFEFEIEFTLLWFPFNSLDDDTLLALDDDTSLLTLDTGADNVLLN